MIESTERRLSELLSERSYCERVARLEGQRLADTRVEIARYLEAQALVQEIAETVQRGAHECVARVVTRCLHSVFGEDSYSFAIDFERRRGKTEASFRLTRGDLTLDDILFQTGGGVVDVVAFALRLSRLLLSNPPNRRVLLLDEPFRYVSAEYRGRVSELLATLSAELSVQMIIVTHSLEFEMGRVVTIAPL